ncbi:MAG TPA: phage minor head protein [Planctomycetaceae bacterium]|nr:phage minor head protein [Planctomycetaceae bacterium]
MTPIISATWDRAGSFFASQVGLDPDHWSVVNSHTAQKIQMAALDFCRETNATTSDDLDAALAKTRQQLQEGIVDEGESVEQLTKRVNAVFDQASKSRARAIAQTETSRAVHAAQEDAAMHSGIVTGWKWLASSDACDVCLAIAARAPTVKLGQPFAIIGTNPTYAKIMYPPAHPHCNCTVTEVLDTDKQPTFHPTLDQPEAVTQSEAEAHAAETRRSYEEIWAGSVAWGAKPRKGIKAKSIRKAKSLPRIKRKVFTSTQ